MWSISSLTIVWVSFFTRVYLRTVDLFKDNLFQDVNPDVVDAFTSPTAIALVVSAVEISNFIVPLIEADVHV